MVLREARCQPALAPGATVAARLLWDRFGEPATESDAGAGLFDFQRDAVTRARTILARRGGVLIADGVGLGKTHIALELMRPALAAGAHVTVVGPAALERHWRRAAVTEASFEWLSYSKLSRGSVRWGSRDIVVFDEAHALRNPGAHRYRHAQTLVRGALVILLTATPVNNSIRDLYHLIRLFAGDRDFADVGVPSLRSAFDEAGATFLLGAAPSLLPILRAVLIRRTRSVLAPGSGSAQARFPEQQPPVPVYYPFSTRAEPDLLGVVSAALADLEFPVHRASGPAPAELLRLSLFKRLESSVHAFDSSIARYDAMLRHADHALARGVLVRASDHEDRQVDQLCLDELLYEQVADGERVAHLRNAVARERALMAPVRAALREIRDGKLAALLDLLDSLRGSRVLVFTQFRETARYLQAHLARRFRTASIDGAGALLGDSPTDRGSVLRRFAPAANMAPAPAEHEKVDVLIATDVLSEGFNLQDASVVVSYDLPWNPIRLVQRVGRIDRLGSPHGTVATYHFLPGDLDRYLGLLDRIVSKARAIEATVGTDMPLLHAGLVRALDRRDGGFLAKVEEDADPFASDARLRSLQLRLPRPPRPTCFEYAVLPARGPRGPDAMVAARVGGRVDWMAIVDGHAVRNDFLCAELIAEAAAQTGALHRPSDPDLEAVLRAARVEIARRQAAVESAPLIPAGGVAHRLGRRLLELAAAVPGGADGALCARIEGAMERLARAPESALSVVLALAGAARVDLRTLIESVEAVPCSDSPVVTGERRVELLAAILRSACER